MNLLKSVAKYLVSIVVVTVIVMATGHIVFYFFG